MGIGTYTFGCGGTNAKAVTGIEVGKCQHGFGLLAVNGPQVKPQVVPVTA
jgi:hypothetical protein